MRLESTFPLEGRVAGQEFLEALPKLKALRVHALPESGAIFNEGTAAVQPDGSFRFASLAPGRYLLQPSEQPRGFYIQRVRLAGVDILGEPADLHRGYGPLEIEFASGPGAVSGTVEGTVEDPAAPASKMYLPLTFR